MSATKHSDSAPISASDPQPNQIQAGNAAAAAPVAEEVGFAECECCGLREECTEAYIERVREIYDGRWVCGLCAEAVKEEICRSSPCRPITTDEALDQHAAFCRSCQSSPVAADANEHLIAAMRQLLRRSLDSPRESGPRLAAPAGGPLAMGSILGVPLLAPTAASPPWQAEEPQSRAGDETNRMQHSFPIEFFLPPSGLGFYQGMPRRVIARFFDLVHGFFFPSSLVSLLQRIKP